MMRCKDPNVFAARVRLAAISQNEVARRAGISQSNLSAIRHGHRRIDETDARVVARILGVRASLLFESVPRARREETTSS